MIAFYENPGHMPPAHYKRTKKVILICLLFALTGCGGAYVGNIEYSQIPDAPIIKTTSTKTVTVATFADSRVDYPESDKRIGRLVGGLGETLRSIEIPQSLSVTVSDITSELLKDAGYKIDRVAATSSNRLTLSGNIIHSSFGLA
ncbi:MAG TPA: hypothetical protein EYG88_07180 [Desulfocapsa sulfexigens]|nr:hypothetical protein [Desulfocapsa sulfexigens]